MKIRGAIFFHKNFEFQNGTNSDKLFILLNTPSKNENYLFVQTTSQQKDKPLQTGCIELRGLFFIPAGRTFFEKNTWVELYEQHEMEPNIVNNSNNIIEMGNLDSKIVDKIIDCIFITQDDNIPPIKRKLLRPPLEENILKLQEKFKSN